MAPTLSANGLAAEPLAIPLRDQCIHEVFEASGREGLPGLRGEEGADGALGG
jgi:hypothetical protein